MLNLVPRSGHTLDGNLGKKLDDLLQKYTKLITSLEKKISKVKNI